MKGCSWWPRGLLAAALFLSVPAAAAAQIGVLGGYNRESLGDFAPAEGFDLSDRTAGYHFGVFYNISLATFSVRPAVIYHRVPKLVASIGGDSTEFNLDLVEIPLDIRMRFAVPKVSPYILAGPVLTFPSSTVSGVNDLLSSRPIRVEVGVGVEIGLGLRLWPELRYGFGVTSLMRSDVPVGTSTLEGEGNPRHSSWSLRLGISF